MDETEKPQTIKWVCWYCGSKEESANISAFDVTGQKTYETIIKEAAKNGGIACHKCFRWRLGYR
jgi:hypothetical protein